MPNAKIGREDARSKRFTRYYRTCGRKLRMMKHLEEHPNIINLHGVTFKDLRPITIVELAVNNLAVVSC